MLRFTDLPGAEPEPLRPFVQPISRMDAETPALDAIRAMRRDNLEILLVVRVRRSGRDIPLGIATMKDLVEEFLGELSEW